MNEQTVSRRDRYREQTRGEILALALRQIADGGVDALSLNAVAKEMAVSGAALYRYFAGRDELLAELVVQAYDDLADDLEAAAVTGRRQDPATRVHTVAAAYRAWALGQPHRYRLIFSTRVGSGALDPNRVVPASQRSMNVFLEIFDNLHGGPEVTGAPIAPDLGAQLQAWHQRSNEQSMDPRVLRYGVACWTRLHGVVSLELDGHLEAIHVDPALLFRAEVDDLVERSGHGRTRTYSAHGR